MSTLYYIYIGTTGKSKQWAFLFFFVLGSTMLYAQQDSAMQAYQTGRYEQAKTIWEQEELAGRNGFALQANLGNACYRLGQYPLAVLHYERALRIAPNDQQVIYNLKVTQAKIPGLPEEPRAGLFSKGWIFFRGLANPFGWTIIYIVCLGIVLLYYIVVMNKSFSVGWRKLNGFFSLLILALIVFFLAYSRYLSLNSDQYAILTDEKGSVLSGADDSATPIQEIPGGTKLFIHDFINRYYKVELPDGTLGWVKQKAITRIKY
jgi:tetratricopeptide (TPR) repeat protein